MAGLIETPLYSSGEAGRLGRTDFIPTGAWRIGLAESGVVRATDLPFSSAVSQITFIAIRRCRSSSDPLL